MEIKIEASASQESLVFRRWSMTGTHEGPFLGMPPTGRKVRLSGVDIERLQKGRIVELRYFTGLTIEETAVVLKISPTTVRREWRRAKAWLYRSIVEGAPG